MSNRRRTGVTLIEILVALSIIGILSGLAVPTVLGVRRNGIAQLALAELRAVDIAVNASCGRGTCGPFLPSGTYAATISTVPASLREFLPSGYRFASDTVRYAIELESWQFWGTGLGGPPPPTCDAACQARWAVAQGPDNTGFTNTAGFAAPPTIYVTVWVVTRNANVAQQLYAKAGGTAPVYVASGNLWKYAYPVLVGVPATG